MRMKRFFSLIVLLALISGGFSGISWADIDYGDVLSSVDPLRVKRNVEFLSSFGSRLTGYPGCDAASEFIFEEFKKIGLQDVKFEEYGVTVPVDKGASLKLPGDKVLPLYCLWPNLVRTSTVPTGGIRGNFIYGKRGNFSDFNGMDVNGSVILLDFNTRNNWLNPSMLGARAIIFIEPDSTVSVEGIYKFLQVPLDIPRFWISKSDAAELLKEFKANGKLEVELAAKMEWERNSARNIMGTIPGTDPVLKDEIIVIESYYDAMSIVPALAPGAEMSCGIVGLLELARYFYRYPPARTLIFVATSGHYMGLRGIDDFLQRHARKEDPFIERMTDPIDLKLFIGIDLSSQTDELGVWNSSASFYLRRYFAPFGRKFMDYSKEISEPLGRNPKDALVNGISPEGGMSWETFVPGGISVDSELVLSAGTPALSFVTVNDARLLVDTPLDLPSRVKYDNLVKQITFLAAAFHKAVNDPELFPDFKMKLKDELFTLHGGLMTFPRRGITPDMPRQGAVAVLRTGALKSVKGVRGDLFEIVDENGEFTISRIRVRSVALEGYYMDPITGDITYAPDRGVQGDKIYPMQFSMDWREKKWMIVLFPCVAGNFYDIVDPRYLTKLSALTVFDESNSTPPIYGYSIGYGPTEPVGVIFAPPKTNLKVAMSSGLIGIRYLLINSQGVENKEMSEGIGYTIDNPSAFIMTSFKAAQDMWTLDEERINELKRFAIKNSRLDILHDTSRKQIELAREALAEKQWDSFVKHTRAALGVESRAYPDVKGTQDDVIKGIIFYMALVLPFAFFGERLIFTFADIRKQIIGVMGLFLLVWLVLNFVHPAFELSNPIVILLAFIVLALAVFVISLVVSRFNDQMKRMKAEAAVVHETDVNRVSASYAAFSLGISNMKRRKVRTTLTFATLVLLTFTVISFTSIKTSLKFNQISRDNEGLYEGALIRTRAWNPLEEPAYEYAETNFGMVGTVVPRSWYISKTKNYIKMKHGDNSANALGVLGLSLREPEVTGIDRALIAGRWFKEGERKVCIVSNDMMKPELLDIDTEDVGKTHIRVFGEDLLVVGVFDSGEMKELRDLDDEIVTPADFQLTGDQTVRELAQEESREKAGLETPKVVIRPFIHLEPANVLILPYDMVRDVGGVLQSVAVRFEKGIDSRALIEDFISRLAVTLFAGIKNEKTGRIDVSVYSSLGLTSFSGLRNIFVPILIAALIVLNTMMGSVYERFREIGIYSSVGLAPVHIGFLFMAESLVYAVLGTVVGYVIGQTLATVLVSRNLISGLTLNYSSLSTVSSSLMVMGVVILSTLYPARKASQMAVPDVTRRWRLPDPEGDTWRFEFPFTVGGRDVIGLSIFLKDYFDSYSEESIGSFYTEGAELESSETDLGENYSISMRVWLAPFDLGVSQEVLFEATPTEIPGIYGIRVIIKRLSGEDSSWRKVNSSFMNSVRKQFLIWKTVIPEAKENYRKRALEMLEISEEKVAGSD